MSAEPPSAYESQYAGLDSVDEDILAQIAALYTRVDPVPDGVVGRVTFTLALAEMEAELAEIELLNAELAGARLSARSVTRRPTTSASTDGSPRRTPCPSNCVRSVSTSSATPT